MHTVGLFLVCLLCQLQLQLLLLSQAQLQVLLQALLQVLLQVLLQALDRVQGQFCHLRQRPHWQRRLRLVLELQQQKQLVPQQQVRGLAQVLDLVQVLAQLLGQLLVQLLCWHQGHLQGRRQHNQVQHLGLRQ